jgi:rifampicin phosphotransferase
MSSGVTTVPGGFSEVSHLQDALQAAHRAPLAQEELVRLAMVWRANFGVSSTRGDEYAGGPDGHHLRRGRMATTTTDFPIPEDLVGFWQWDQLHCPRALTVLEHELLLASTGWGFSKAIAELGSGLRAVTKSINGYNYLSGQPLDLGDEDPQARAERYRHNVDALLPVLGERWEKEWLPSIIETVSRRIRQDYGTMSDPDLLRTWDEMYAEVKDRWYIHGLLLYAFFAAGQFADLYREVTAADDEKLGYEALQGFETMATRSARGLWQLSRKVRANPELQRIFEGSNPADIMSELDSTESGRVFMSELGAYLDEFGWRADSVYELTHPAWREDPRIAINAIQGYLAIEDDHGPDSQQRSAIRRREELLADAHARIGNDSARLKKFNATYDSIRCFTSMIEDHNHWIDQVGDISMRYPALELGRRSVARGTLARTEDIFHLERADIVEAMNGVDKKEVAAQRRADLQRFAGIVPPPFIGPPPPPSDDPVVDVIVRFFGLPVEPNADPRVINGVAASPGTVTAKAKVVRSLAEASKLLAGDVLVCEMTLPPWTPLFSTASAVVADTGGILSHCAIVARETRIPCVVGTMTGTSLIKDGQTITVDGSRGIVRIES